MSRMAAPARTPVSEVEVDAFTVPTDAPEADGTFEWQQTTMVVVEIDAGGGRGLGYSYIDASAATLIRGSLAAVVRGRSAMDVPAAWIAMVHAIRNLGRPGDLETQALPLVCCR